MLFHCFLLWSLTLAMPVVENPSLASPAANGAPANWQLYKMGQGATALRRSAAGHLVLDDRSTAGEIGIVQTVPAAETGKFRIAATARSLPGRSGDGAYLQVVCLPSKRLFQTEFIQLSDTEFSDTVLEVTPPEDTQQWRITIYSHRAPTPGLEIKEVGVSVDQPLVFQGAKRELFLATPVVVDGRARSVIASAECYRANAEAIAEAIEKKTGVRPAVVDDDWKNLPKDAHVILLGNRLTSRIAGRLYDLHYLLIDARLPGPGGYELRSVHNPFGDGRNFIAVGGSDDDGVAQAAEQLIRLVGDEAAPGRLALGHLAETRLSPDYELPEDPYLLLFRESCAGYGLQGYFGWNILTRCMALFYHTNELKYAELFKKLAFPADRETLDYLERGGEHIEDKRNPLAKPYHYSSHLQILYWDLIEENPAFSDEDREKITAELFKQYRYMRDDPAAGMGCFERARSRRWPAIGTRHHMWVFNTLYNLARYFGKYYPHEDFKTAVRAVFNSYHSLYRDDLYLIGEQGNHFWYGTSLEPIVSWLIIAEQGPKIKPANLRKLVDTYEMYATGERDDWITRYTASNFYHKLYRLTGDGRALRIRDLCRYAPAGFAVGQSFDPGPDAKPVPLRHGVWMLDRPGPVELARWSKEYPKMENGFRYAAFRSAADGSGDLLALDGYFDDGRNSYHCFGILGEKIDGYRLLAGFRNQVFTAADGMVASLVNRSAEMVRQGGGESLFFAEGKVHRFNGADWTRLIAHRTGRYGVVMDEFVPTATATDLEITFSWELAKGAAASTRAPGVLRFEALNQAALEEVTYRMQNGVLDFRVHESAPERKPFAVTMSDPLETAAKVYKHSYEGGSGQVTEMLWNSAVKKSEARRFFTLIAPAADDRTACVRLAEHAALLRLDDGPALAGSTGYRQLDAALAVIGSGHLLAIGAKAIPGIFTADRPLDLLWDFSGKLEILADADTVVTWPDGSRLAVKRGRSEHRRPGDSADYLDDFDAAFDRAEAARNQPAAAAAAETEALPPLSPLWRQKLAGFVEPTAVIDDDRTPLFAAAAGRTVSLIDPAGKIVRTIDNDSSVKAMTYWKSRKLLLTGGIEDELVKAFSLDGKLAWSFRSETAPGLFLTGKSYWYRTHPGMAGVRSIYIFETAPGKERAFVGSACTLELLTPEGKLDQRLHMGWGCIDRIWRVEDGDGKPEFFTHATYNGTQHLLRAKGDPLVYREGDYYRYLNPPPSLPVVIMWAQLNREHLLEADLDGDGKPEIIGDLRGAFNRITAWDKESSLGKYDVAFGQGPAVQLPSNLPRLETTLLRDMLVADLDADGKLEVAAILSKKLLLIFDGKLQLKRCRRLPFEPMSLVAAGRNLYLTGREGGLFRYDAVADRFTAAGETGGPPASLQRFGSLLLVPCTDGTITAFQIQAEPKQGKKR